MAELSTGSTYVLKPRGRKKFRWQGLTVVVLALLVVIAAAHLGVGDFQKNGLEEEIAALREAGEPMLAEDFAMRPVAENENAALWLKRSVQAIDEHSYTWSGLQNTAMELPLSESKQDRIRQALEKNREALALLHEARSKKGVDWQVKYDRPIECTSEWFDFRKLELLAVGDMLLEHHLGREREALERARDLLALSRLLDQRVVSACHLWSGGIAQMVSEKLEEMALDLRIGTGEQEVSAEEIRKLIAELLDESAMHAAQRKEIRWERAGKTDQMVCLADGRYRRSWGFSDICPQLQLYVMKPSVLRDSRLVLEHWSEIVKISDQSQDWPSYQRAVSAPTRASRKLQKRPKLSDLAISITQDNRLYVRDFWEAIAERRMAAVALAVRLYWLSEGKMPAALDELVPKYLPQVPRDPMAEGGKALGYISNAQRPVVYSIGENGTDEKGSEKAMPRTYGDSRWEWEDAVVHLKDQKRTPREFRPIYGYGYGVAP